MSFSLPHFLLLVCVIGRAVVLVKPSDSTIRCGYDNCCEAMMKLFDAVKQIETKLDEQVIKVHEIHGKQAKDLEELKKNLDRSLASTAVISTQLEKHSADLLSHHKVLKAHDEKQIDALQHVQNLCSALHKPKDCSDIRESGHNISGVYQVYPGSGDNRIKIDVYCDFRSAGQSWLVFQRRKDGSVKFERSWTDYANGFGDLTGEFWLGNEKVSQLTMNKKYKLRVELEDFAGEKRYAEYTTFNVKPATDNYRLTVGGYSGNAGDSLTWHNGMQFSTKDAENDVDGTRNCAILFHGAWWYNSCHTSNLNGLYLRGAHESYADGVEWIHWHGQYYSLKTTEMKIAAVI